MSEPATYPNTNDVRELTRILDMLDDFPSNEQRARYLLTCNWMHDRGAAAQQNARDGLAATLATLRGTNDSAGDGQD